MIYLLKFETESSLKPICWSNVFDLAIKPALQMKDKLINSVFALRLVNKNSSVLRPDHVIKPALQGNDRLMN